MRRDDQINQALQMYVLLLRNKQLFTGGIAQIHNDAVRFSLSFFYLHVHVVALQRYNFLLL